MSVFFFFGDFTTEYTKKMVSYTSVIIKQLFDCSSREQVQRQTGEGLCSLGFRTTPNVENERQQGTTFLIKLQKTVNYEY